MSSSAIAMNAGTIALNAEGGSVSRRVAPTIRRARTRRRADRPAALAAQLASVADGAGHRAGDEPDRVGDVRGHGGVAEAEEHGT